MKSCLANSYTPSAVSNAGASVDISGPIATIRFPMNQPVRVGVGVVVSPDQGRVLACLRPTGTPWAGWWEFPGGKCEPGESAEACIVRELIEEIDLTVRLVAPLPELHHGYPEQDRTVRLIPWICSPVAGQPRPVEVAEVRWCTPAELRGLRFLPANGPLIDAVEAWLRRHPATPP